MTLRNIFRINLLLILALMMALPTSSKSYGDKPRKLHFPPGFVGTMLSPNLRQDLGLPNDLHGFLVTGLIRFNKEQNFVLKVGDIITEVPVFKKGKMKKKMKPVKSWEDTKELLDSAHEYEAPKPIKVKLHDGREVQLQKYAMDFSLKHWVSGPTSSRENKTIRVASDGTGDYRSIQRAILNAKPGNTISIAEGLYGPFTVTVTNLKIVGDGEDNVLIQAPIFIQYVYDTHIKGVTISGMDLAETKMKPTHYGIYYNKAGLTFEDSAIIRCEYGIYGFPGRAPIQIRNNKITNNTQWGLNMSLCESKRSEIVNNLIAKNGVGREIGSLATGGIKVSSSGKCDWNMKERIPIRIQNNTIVNNKLSTKGLKKSMRWGFAPGTGLQVEAHYDHYFEVANNIIAFNDVGFYMGYNSLSIVLDGEDPASDAGPGKKIDLHHNNSYGNVIETDKGTLNVSGGNWDYIYKINSVEKNESRSVQILPNTPAFTIAKSRAFTWAEPVKDVGPNNLSVDPLFVNPDQGDYRLKPESPLLKKGVGGKPIGAINLN